MQSSQSSLHQDVLHGLLMSPIPDEGKTAPFLEEVLVALAQNFGEFTSVGLVGEGLPKEERYHYNARVLKDPQEMGIEPQALCDTHNELMRVTVDRLYHASSIVEVEVGLAPGWINPYVHDTTQLHMGMAVIMGELPDHWEIRISFDKPGLWFALAPQPLFESDAMVRQHPDVKWNKGDKGIIVARDVLVEQNRLRLAQSYVDLIRRTKARAAFLGFDQVRYHWKTDVAHISRHEDPKNGTPALVFRMMPEGAALEVGDQLSKPSGKWRKVEGGGLSLEVDDVWFDHFTSRDLET